MFVCLVSEQQLVEAFAAAAAASPLYGPFVLSLAVDVIPSLIEDCSSSSSSSRFELPQDLLLQLQEETGISIDSAAAADAASSSSSSSNNNNNSNNSSSSKELRESWSSDLYRCLLLLHKVYRHLRLISPNESADDISTSVIR